MSNTRSFPDTVNNPRKPAHCIEIDNDAVVGEYADGEWESLVSRFVANWTEEKQFKNTATLLMCASQSVNFGELGYSVFVAGHGFPSGLLNALHKHLQSLLPRKVRIAGDVLTSPGEGWSPRVHVQDGAAWTPIDAATWQRVPVSAPTG